MDTNTCGFELANLSPYVAQELKQSALAPICKEMLNACVVNGFDGIANQYDGNTKLIFSLFGQDCPPPYPVEECIALTGPNGMRN